MKFVTNRTVSDAMLRSNSGQYTHEDLNRVEKAVRYLSLIARVFIDGPVFNPQTKTDWGAPGLFSVSSWNAATQMERYLNNVKTLCQTVGIQADLPESMRFLTAEGANQIEEALALVYDHILESFNGFQYSGEIYAGEENGL